MNSKGRKAKRPLFVENTTPLGRLTVDESTIGDIPPAEPTPDGTMESIVGRGVLRCGVVGDRTGVETAHLFQFCRIDRESFL